MKTSIIGLLPSAQDAGELAIDWGSGQHVSTSRQLRQHVETGAPTLRILPTQSENNDLFRYAMDANNSPLETLVFGFLAASALAALVITFG